MRNAPAALAFAAIALASTTATIPSRAQVPAPELVYSADGKLNFHTAYRTWVFLSSGLDMSYRALSVPGRHSFTNVFVNPNAYAEFQKTGTWPDKTMFMLEVR